MSESPEFAPISHLSTRDQLIGKLFNLTLQNV
jgi:hypothetical protein